MGRALNVPTTRFYYWEISAVCLQLQNEQHLGLRAAAGAALHALWMRAPQRAYGRLSRASRLKAWLEGVSSRAIYCMKSLARPGPYQTDYLGDKPHWVRQR